MDYQEAIDRLRVKEELAKKELAEIQLSLKGVLSLQKRQQAARASMDPEQIKKARGSREIS
jgi:hypothetical protein